MLQLLSNNKSKYIISLQNKKQRLKSGNFLVEGEKNVLELLESSFGVECLVISQAFFDKHQNYLLKLGIDLFLSEPNQLAKLGTFETNEAAIAIAICKENKPLYIQENEWVLALDQVRDPGNLGTIIRVADWYGIKKIICSFNTAELYNPKVIAATMGSFSRVAVYYTELAPWLSEQKASIFAAVMEGNNTHQQTFPDGGILVMGNESNGISPEVLSHCLNKITIPRFGGAESLNVAIATAVICDGIRRTASIAFEN
jgi:TrmH family RNA methyltransferase